MYYLLGGGRVVFPVSKVWLRETKLHPLF